MDNNVNQIISGASSGFIKIMVGYPFETIKTRKQLNLNYNYNLKNLYRGCSIPLITSSLKRSIQLYNYEKYNSKNKNTYIAGAYGGIISSILLNPFNILKTNIQSNKYSTVYSQLNFKILNKGYGISIVRDTLFSTYYLGTYGFLKKNLPDKPLYHSLCGVLSGTSVWLLFSPFDFVRTKIYNGNNYSQIIKYIIKNPLHMWNGCKPMIIKSIPLNLINMAIYEYLKKNLK